MPARPAPEGPARCCGCGCCCCCWGRELASSPGCCWLATTRSGRTEAKGLHLGLPGMVRLAWPRPGRRWSCIARGIAVLGFRCSVPASCHPGGGRGGDVAGPGGDGRSRGAWVPATSAIPAAAASNVAVAAARDPLSGCDAAVGPRGGFAARQGGRGSRRGKCAGAGDVCLPSVPPPAPRTARRNCAFVSLPTLGIPRPTAPARRALLRPGEGPATPPPARPFELPPLKGPRGHPGRPRSRLRDACSARQPRLGPVVRPRHLSWQLCAERPNTSPEPRMAEPAGVPMDFQGGGAPGDGDAGAGAARGRARACPVRPAQASGSRRERQQSIRWAPLATSRARCWAAMPRGERAEPLPRRPPPRRPPRARRSGQQLDAPSPRAFSARRRGAAPGGPRDGRRAMLITGICPPGSERFPRAQMEPRRRSALGRSRRRSKRRCSRRRT